MLTDTGPSVTIATPGIIAGLHHGKASWPYVDEMSLWRHGARLRCSLLMLASDKVISARCERLVTAWLEGSLDAVNSVIQLSFKIYH